MKAKPKIRGRFSIEHNDDGWCVLDHQHSSVMCGDTRREAEAEAKFCRAYVKKWGDINFNSYPWDLNESPQLRRSAHWKRGCRMKRGEVVRVTVDLWIDVEALKRDERDVGFDMGDDPREDAAYLVQQAVDALTAPCGRCASAPRGRTAFPKTRIDIRVDRLT